MNHHRGAKMTEQRNVAQINELSHNQALLTLAAERRELLATRNEVVELQQLVRQQAAALQQSKEHTEGLEAEVETLKVEIEGWQNTAQEKSE